MKNSKFITLLSTLTPKELSAFTKHVKRTVGSSGVVPSVFSYIKKCGPDFQDAKKLDIEYAYQKIFGEDIGRNRIKLLNTLYDLNKLLKQFLLFEKLNKKTFENRLLWLEILKERQLKSEFSRHAASLLRDIQNLPKKGISDYMKGMMSNHYFYYHLIQDKLSKDTNTLKRCGENLDLFYAVSRLKIACEMANQRNLFSLEYNLQALPIVIELAKSESVSNHPLLQLYLYVYQLVADEKDQCFPLIDKMLVDKQKEIDPEELHTILSYLHNYAAAQFRKGNNTYLKMTHRLNCFMVEHKIFSNSGEMSVSQFNNIVHTACKLKDYTWASSFQSSHQILLSPSVRENGALLAEAIILFEKNKFSAALKKLGNVAPDNLLLAIRSKSLSIICHYELAGDGGEDVVELCLAFKAYLNRKKKDKMGAVIATLRFVHIVKLLSQRKKEKNDILAEIKMDSPVYFKEWLEEKANQYKPFRLRK